MDKAHADARQVPAPAVQHGTRDRVWHRTLCVSVRRGALAPRLEMGGRTLVYRYYKYRAATQTRWVKSSLIEMTVTSQLHARAERRKKQKREEKAASSGGADKDSDPEDGAKARGPLHYGRIAPRVEDFLPHATWVHRDLRMCVFIELESLAERSEMVTTGLPWIFP